MNQICTYEGEMSRYVCFLNSLKKMGIINYIYRSINSGIPLYIVNMGFGEVIVEKCFPHLKYDKSMYVESSNPPTISKNKKKKNNTSKKKLKKQKKNAKKNLECKKQKTVELSKVEVKKEPQISDKMKFAESNLDNIITDYLKNNLTRIDICAKYNISLYMLEKICKKHNIRKNKRRKL